MEYLLCWDSRLPGGEGGVRVSFADVHTLEQARAKAQVIAAHGVPVLIRENAHGYQLLEVVEPR